MAETGLRWRWIFLGEDVDDEGVVEDGLLLFEEELTVLGFKPLSVRWAHGFGLHPQQSSPPFIISFFLFLFFLFFCFGAPKGCHVYIYTRFIYINTHTHTYGSRGF